MPKPLIISNKPSRWDNNLYDVFPLIDLVDIRYKTPRTIIIIDDTITVNDLKSFETDFNYNLFQDLGDNYLSGYSILIKPAVLHYDKTQKWFLLGNFRFKSNKLFNILSKNKSVDLNTFFNSRENIIELRHENIQAPSADENQEKLQLAKEDKYKEEHQKRVEIVTETIRSFQNYTDFMKNRMFFTKFVSNNIQNTEDLENRIKEADINEYSKNIFINIRNKYMGVLFPYTKKDPLRIYYVIVLHNRILKDRLFDKNRQKIADTIGVFSNDKVKGCIIQSVLFTPIPEYDHVQLIKIKNDDNYYIWMKPEPDNKTKTYETHLKSFRFIKNAIQNPKKQAGLIGGLTRKISVKSKNKTRSAKSFSFL